MDKITGQCLCGEIAFEINGPLGPIVNCHCLLCRRWYGSAFRTRSAVKSKYFSWVRGEALLSKFHSSEKVIKTFCSKCGSNLISILENDPDHIGLPMGAINQSLDAQPSMNIFVGSKAPWYEISDGLPQYDEWPPGGANAVRGSK